MKTLSEQLAAASPKVRPSVKPTFNKDRPLSWSAISSFEYDPEQWYKKYVLGEAVTETKEMVWGKMVAESFGTDKPLAPVEIYPVVEHKMAVIFNKMKLIGYIDTYDPATHNFREYKTGKKPWTQDRANEHGQLKMYALMLYVSHKVTPDKYTIFLDYIPTKENGDFSVDFVKPIKVHSFQVHLTMQDILRFAARINETVKAMEAYAQKHE